MNETEVEFTPVTDRPGYWEGYAPRMPGLQDIEIWAESDSGLRGHLECTVMLDYHAHTEARLLKDDFEVHMEGDGADVRLLLLPWVVRLVKIYEMDVMQEQYNTQLKRCRKVVG